MYYKAIDLANGVFAKYKIADDSSARIALGYVHDSKVYDDLANHVPATSPVMASSTWFP